LNHMLTREVCIGNIAASCVRHWTTKYRLGQKILANLGAIGWIKDYWLVGSVGNEEILAVSKDVG